MNDHPQGQAERPSVPDDDRLGAMVRATVDEWRLPPQRLDQPTWRDQVAARRGNRGRGWLGRLAVPTAAAIVGTVAVAFVAVWLTAPRVDRAIVGASHAPSATVPNAAASARPTHSPLPVLFRNGDLPTPAQILVRAGGDYQVADLATGEFAAFSISRHSGPTTVVPRPGGGWLCVCADWVGSSPTGLDVTLEVVDASGAPGARTVIRSIRGESDGTQPVSQQPELVDVRAIGSADGHFVFVGWSARHAAAGWTAGIDVVDVASATVVSSTPLAFKEPAAAEGRPSTRTAPAIELAPSGDLILVSSFWYAESGPATPPSGTDHWTAAFDGRRVRSLTPAGVTPGARCGEVDRGLIDDATYYVLCWTPDGRFMVERNRVDGTAIGQTAVPEMSRGIDGGSPSTRVGDALFLWDARALHVSRFDLRSGAVTTATAVASAPPSGSIDTMADVARQLGHWLAPSVLAKVLLEPALVASPDGSRIYAIGITGASRPDQAGSTGVFVFDAATLSALGHWAPTADFASLAISPDGRFVYAGGQGGRDAAGNTTTEAASITVYDATDGSIRLIAGDLGSSDLYFPGPTLQ
ncbi:MAG: hypothetical protein ABJC39_03360 [Chloroflexota bacterium]